jgi:hypothetical protein
MPYQITAEIKARASKAGVIVKPSRNKDKKLDAFDHETGKFQASFGGKGYNDYHLWKKQEGETVANQKRKQYKARHEKDRKVKYRDGKLTAGWLADKILW